MELWQASWAGLQHSSVHVTYRTWVEATRQLHSLVCALAGAGERLHLTLSWLVHKGVKSEVTPGEASWRTPQPDYWPHSDPGHRKSHRICGTTLKYMNQDWTSSAADACVVDSMS